MWRLNKRRSLSSIVCSVDNPYTGEIVFQRHYDSQRKCFQVLEQAHDTWSTWRRSSLQTRKDLCEQLIEHISGDQVGRKIGSELADTVGKPFVQGVNEHKTMINRAKALLNLADEALKDINLPDVDEPKSTLRRSIVREPIGPVLVLSPWNYPYLCAINVIIPAILSGNTVVLKHSDRTSQCAYFFQQAFDDIGAPQGLVSAVTTSHEIVAEMVQHPRVAYVAFTGSVKGGRTVYEKVAASPKFLDVGLELGGKDAAYVSQYADIDAAVDGVVDGAMYNAGQSCCAVERVYVNQQVYDEFVHKAVELVKTYQLGNPRNHTTNMGPIAQKNWPNFLEKQVEHAKNLGAQVLVGGSKTTDSTGKGRFFAPTVVTNCTHNMSLMVDESFGPILAISKPVASDEEAIKLINDSPYGLTASIWSNDADHALRVAAELDVGTVFQNRCDFVDPALPWAGRHDSGKGGPSCSTLGYIPLTRSKAYNFRITKKI